MFSSKHSSKKQLQNKKYSYICINHSKNTK
jgi:hypothetical protein